MSTLPWIALLLPLASAFVIAIATRPLRAVSGFISVGAVLGSFLCGAWESTPEGTLKTR